ncbi:hypothetical protein [Erysipelothrix sp. P66]|uniref:hypothetical protein n=1 Tax=Erysipelothrix sp. P66 TaxID=3141531 RepID=UPI00315DED71
MQRFKIKWLLFASAMAYAYYSFFYKSPTSGIPIAVFTILLSWFFLECYFDFLYQKRKLTFKFNERMIIGLSSILILVGITGGDLMGLSRLHLLIFSSLWLGLLLFSALYLLRHAAIDPRTRVLNQFVEQMLHMSEFGLQCMHTLYQAMVLTDSTFPIDNLILTIYADSLKYDHLDFEIPSPKLEHFMIENVAPNHIEQLLNHHVLENHFEGIQAEIQRTLKDVLEDGTFEVTGISPLYRIVVFAYAFNQIIILDRSQMDVHAYQMRRLDDARNKKQYHRLMRHRDAFGILQAFRDTHI